MLIYKTFYINPLIARFPGQGGIWEQRREHAATPRKILPISATNLQDVFDARDRCLAWLRPRQPITKIGYSILIYDLSGTLGGIDGIGADLCCRRTVTRDEVSQSR
jgi:hypothetical protein